MARRNLQVQEKEGGEAVKVIQEVNYTDLTWPQIRALASKAGVLRVGMNRWQIEQELQALQAVAK